MKYFSIEELTRSSVAKREGIDNTPPAEAVASLERLVEEVLDPLREAWGSAVTVTSGYRCKKLNDAVGGVVNSQHMLGQAADLTVGCERDNARLMDLIRELRLPVDQVIAEHAYKWLHVSWRERGRRQFLYKAW